MNKQPLFPLLTVVTIDDSPLIAERMDSILREIDNVSFLGNAFNILSAQNLINEVKPNVVILDIHLEKNTNSKTGIDLLVEIRKNYPEMKVIIFTNHNEQHYRTICLEKGADYFLDKSTDSNKISEILEQWTIKK